jgi:hypothetical protein
MTNMVFLRVKTEALDDAVLRLLRHAGQPLCVSTMSFLLDRPTRDICMALNRLRKYRQTQIKKVTARRMQFWEAVPAQS